MPSLEDDTSEKNFRYLMDTAPVMVWVTGPDKLCTFFNVQWLAFTGDPADLSEREVAVPWDQCCLNASKRRRAICIPPMRRSLCRDQTKGTFMLRRTVVGLAIAFVILAPTLVTNAIAADSTFGGGHISSGEAARRGDRVPNDDERGHEWGRRSHEWDPWGHWGAYYGPNPAPL